jgi:hypothetical protein
MQQVERVAVALLADIASVLVAVDDIVAHQEEMMVA